MKRLFLVVTAVFAAMILTTGTAVAAVCAPPPCASPSPSPSPSPTPSQTPIGAPEIRAVATNACGNPKIQVSPSTLQAGDKATVTGSGWGAGTTVQLNLDGDAVATVTTDSYGKFTETVKVPENAGKGSHTITASGLDSTCQNKGTSERNVTVVEGATATNVQPKTLPFTGSGTGAGLFVLAALLIAGAAVTVFGRRRETTGS